MVIFACNEKEPAGVVATFALHVHVDIAIAVARALPNPLHGERGLAIYNPSTLLWLYDTDEWLTHEAICARIQAPPPEPEPPSLAHA